MTFPEAVSAIKAGESVRRGAWTWVTASWRLIPPDTCFNVADDYHYQGIAVEDIEATDWTLDDTKKRKEEAK